MIIKKNGVCPSMPLSLFDPGCPCFVPGCPCFVASYPCLVPGCPCYVPGCTVLSFVIVGQKNSVAALCCLSLTMVKTGSKLQIHCIKGDGKMAVMT